MSIDISRSFLKYFYLLVFCEGLGGVAVKYSQDVL